MLLNKNIKEDNYYLQKFFKPHIHLSLYTFIPRISHGRQVYLWKTLIVDKPLLELI